MLRSRSFRLTSRPSCSSSRNATLSPWRNVSTTSMASISSSSAGAPDAAGPLGVVATLSAMGSYRPASVSKHERVAFSGEPCHALLAILDRIADFGAVLRGKVAHLGNDLGGAGLEVDDTVDEFLDGVSADGRAVKIGRASCRERGAS